MAKVQWSATRNGTARATGSVYSFPGTATALAVKGSWLLFAEVSYDYTPTVGYTISGTLTLSDHDVHEPAYYRAHLRRHDLHLTAAAMPAGLRRSATQWSI